MKSLSNALGATVLGLLTFAAGAGTVTRPAAAAVAPVAAPPAISEPLLIEPAAIDAALRGLVESGRIVGVSALVYQGDREAYFGAFGMADRENDKPMARDTLVQIYSMTKPVTGVALMKLYERGKFQLDDPLEQYVPEFADQRVYAGLDDAGGPKYEPLKRRITIRDLMRHTAGFVNEEDQDPVGNLYRQVDPRAVTNTLPDFAAKLAQVPLAYQPGTRWRYSHAADLQAYLVQKMSGVPFDRFLELHIFKPLGMTSTRFTVLPTDADRSKLAAVYLRNEDGSLVRRPDEEAYKFNGQEWPLKPGGFGLVSTLDDYMKFARMLRDGGKYGRARILRPETVKLMATDAMPKEVTDTMWLKGKGEVGFGIDLAVRIAPPRDADESSGAVGEFFWDGKLSTLFWVDPRNDIVAVLFTQVEPFDRTPHKAFRDAVYRNDPLALAH